MALALDCSTDYATVYDFPESVTLGVRQAGDAYGAVQVAKAFRGQPSVKERAPSRGVYQGADLLWLLPARELSGAVPKPSDVVTDGQGVEWTLLTADYDQLDRVYACYSLNLVVHLGLYDAVNLYRPTATQDAAGSYVFSAVPAYTGLVARVQEQQGEFAEGREVRGTTRTYEIYLARNVTVTTDYYAEDRSGNRYDVLSWRNRERLDEAMVLTCERRP